MATRTQDDSTDPYNDEVIAGLKKRIADPNAPLQLAYPYASSPGQTQVATDAGPLPSSTGSDPFKDVAPASDQATVTEPPSPDTKADPYAIDTPADPVVPGTRTDDPAAYVHADSTVPATTTVAPADAAYAYSDPWYGWDPTRMAGGANDASGSLKYDAQQVLSKYDPNQIASDVTMQQKALAELNALHPGQYELDNQGNFMLTGTADGYIGARPETWANGQGVWDDNAKKVWQWLAYNQAHPGPNGETGAAPATATAANTGVGSGMPGEIANPAGGASDVTTGASTPQGADPFTAMGGGVWVPGVGWVTKDNPAAQTPGAVTGTGNTATTPATVDSATRAKLLQLMTMDPNATSVDDPSIKPAATAFERARERQLDRQRQANAEKFAAQGLGSSGGLDTANAQAWEGAGQDIAANQASLVTQQIAAKREDVMNALNLGKGILTADQETQLRLQLANIDASLRQRALALQAQQLDQQNNQFYDNLGYQIGSTEATLNANASR
jgi:hypothetical protein